MNGEAAGAIRFPQLVFAATAECDDEVLEEDIVDVALGADIGFVLGPWMNADEEPIDVNGGHERGKMDYCPEDSACLMTSAATSRAA